jgi:ribosomal protein S2
MYSFEDLKKANKKFLKKETNEKSEKYLERRLIGVKVDNCKKIEKVYQDLIKQVSNLENRDSQTLGKLKKKLKNKSKLPKVFIYSRASAKTPELERPEVYFKEKKSITRSKSPVIKKLNI